MAGRVASSVLEYVGIRVRDLARARRFYCDGLGLSFVKAGRMAAGGQWEELRDPESGFVLELNFYPDHPPYREGDELDHLAFRVDDLDATIDQLERMGARVRIPPFVEGPTRLAFMSDPDGVWLELEARAGGDAAPASREGD
ncbi:MAG: VOC family protein [Thermoplasmata archaeon]|nr:VOC family protein [Thermoplasmata archaeon]